MSSVRDGKALFLYGSLMVPQVWELVVGRAAVMQPARLADHVRRALHGAVYPGLVPRQGEHTEGRLVGGIDKRELARLDAFEGELYQRTPCVVESEGERAQAFVYVVRPAHRGLLSPRPWDLDRFVADELPAYLEGCRRFAADLDPGA